MEIIKVFHWVKCGCFWRCVRLLLLGSAICSVFSTLSASGTKKRAEKRTTYGTGVETGFKFVRHHDNCMLLRAFFISDDFFLGLKEVDTPTGKQFAKRKKIYTTFPDTIIVDVEADVFPCDISAQRLPPLDIASGLLGSMSFGASWTSNNQSLESNVLVPIKVVHPRGGMRWDYFLEIPAKDIPLTTGLVIRLTAREHIELGTLSANL